MEVRAAVDRDQAEILEIYNDVVRTSDAVFTETERRPLEQQAWWQQQLDRKTPVLVAVDDSGEVIGFGSYGPFRPWPGYRYTVEHSVHIQADRRGAGVGTALVTELVRHAGREGLHAMVAGIDSANQASLRLHRRLGFQDAGLLREVASKHGRWLDLVLMQRLLGTHDS